MKFPSITFRNFCVIFTLLLFVLPIAQPLSLLAGNRTAPSQQGIVYLPIAMTPSGAIIPETTNILTEATTAFLASISNEGVFTFNQMTPEIAKVAPGEIIVGGVNAAAPNGFLRMVTAISAGGGQVIVQTAPATLEDAIEQAEISLSRILSPADVQEQSLASGVTLLGQNEFFFKIEDVVLYDADGNRQTTNDQILANGSILLKPEFDFSAVIQQRRLEQLVFIPRSHETAELEIEARVAAVSAKREFEIARHNFTAITVYVPTPFGPLPVVLTPILTIHVGMDGSVHAGVRTGITQQALLTAGVTYTNSSWNPIGEFSNSFQFNPPTLSAGLDLKGYAGPELALMVYGVVGPYIEVNAYVKLEANLFDTPWWKLYGGLEAPLGVKVTILGRSLADYQVVTIGYRKVLIQAGTTMLVSATLNGTPGNNLSDTPRISADGRYVVFESHANNLVSGDTNGVDDVFIYEIQTGQITRVSVATDGTQGNGGIDRPAISADGRYVVFESKATNLVSGDTNGTTDIFVRDRLTNQTSRVSVASNGTQSNRNPDEPVISADGRYVVFEDWASTLVSGDTNNAGDIFVHDRQTSQTSRVSVASDGAQANDWSSIATISGDGRYVAFVSRANNLVNGDTNSASDIFVHDRQTRQTSRVSVASNGTQGNDTSDRTAISADGRYVAFASLASNLVSGDTNDAIDIFVYDRQTAQTSRVSVNSSGVQGNQWSDRPAISADGRYVSFESDATNLVSGDTNGFTDVFVHDRQSGQTTRVSIASTGMQGNALSYWSTVSADGRYVAFGSVATNLVSNDTNSTCDIFIYDRGY